MNSEPLTWSRDAICLGAKSMDASTIAAEIYRRTCRVDFEAPGFCVVNLGHDIDSVACRRLMVDLKYGMAAIHHSTTGKGLTYLSAARFDQQETTRPHLDAGPDECLLMLGYEPSAIQSELEIFDYAKCAFDHGLSAQEFMAAHNPMFKSSDEILRPYATRVPCFSTSDHQIICINNSCAAYSETRPAWQGTLHRAKIPAPDEAKRRVINSTMIAAVPAGTPDTVSDDTLKDFVTTSVVHRRSYGRPQLEDDR